MNDEEKIRQLQKKVEILENMVEETTRSLFIKNEEIQTALTEKETLLKEIHHRVKNNLQIISSLLNLQSQYLENDRFSSIICESKNRIASMALIHEMLYSTRNLSHVNVLEYVNKLSQSVCRSYTIDDSNIVFKYSIKEEIYLDTDNMIPIGLMLNEIVSNAVKYAFPDKKGLISISFSKKKNRYYLKVQDDGIGIPNDFDHSKAKSLGIQLIHILAEQLNGELNLDRKKGTKYELAFSV